MKLYSVIVSLKAQIFISLRHVFFFKIPLQAVQVNLFFLSKCSSNVCVDRKLPLDIGKNPRISINLVKKNNMMSEEP